MTELRDREGHSRGLLDTEEVGLGAYCGDIRMRSTQVNGMARKKSAI